MNSASAAAQSGVSPLDYVRRRYLATLHTITQRSIVVYATRWTTPGPGLPVTPLMLQLAYGDMTAFMEAVHDLTGDNLDLILHSPGGSPEAAEAIVIFLRSKFKHIRVIVPHMAMSAATMIACAADQIVMGQHSFIGPIDPQLTLQTGMGLRTVPCQAIVDQFNRAVDECKDPNKIRAWLPMLTQYGPDLLMLCENANKLSKELVSRWLKNYMFRGRRTAQKKANTIAEWMADHNSFKTHGRPISRDEARAKGMNIVNLEDDPIYEDMILSTYYALCHTFAQTPVAKIVENHLGKAYIETAVMVPNVFAPMQPGPPPQPPLATAGL